MSKDVPNWPVIDGVKVASVTVDGEVARQGETPMRRNAVHKDALVTHPYCGGIDTVPDVLAYAARTHGTRNAMGWRDVVTMHEEEKDVKKTVGGKEVVEKKKWKYFELSGYKYINYVEVKERADEVAAGLIELGVQKDDVFNIYSQTW